LISLQISDPQPLGELAEVPVQSLFSCVFWASEGVVAVVAAFDGTGLTPLQDID
jgi:hypothetical protein